MTETAEPKLGFITPLARAGKDKNQNELFKPSNLGVGVNTRTALWQARWPAIALQACIDKVEAAPPEAQREVKFNLPCKDCEKSSACLNAKRKELGPLLYDREILTNPRSSESSLFPMELVGKCCHRGLSLLPYYHKPFSLESYFKVVTAWDLAWSEKIGGDYLVSMTGVIDLRDGTKTLIDIQRWQQISFDDQVKLIDGKWGTYGADLVVIESDAAQKIWTQHTARNTSVPVMEHSAAEKKDLAMGVPGLLIALENRKWVFPYMQGSLRHEEIVNFMAELEAFGWVDGKLEGIGEHDDTVMCWYHLDWGLNRFAQQQAGGNMGDTLRGNIVPGARA